MGMMKNMATIVSSIGLKGIEVPCSGKIAAPARDGGG